MTPEMTIKLKRSLIKHEDYRNKPYTDTLGNITIGIGYNLSARGIDDDWINKQYDADVSFFNDQLQKDFPWFENLNDDRKIILIDMCFMGYKKFLTFKRMLFALAQGDYHRAAAEMLDSQWAKQVGNRAQELAHGMLSGVYDV